MESLSKHQLILVAVLISFVTSLMTGIVTVSLMDQAPTGVTRTITQVIQQTIAGSVPTGASSTASVAIAVSDQVAEATAAVAPSIVRLRDMNTKEVYGLGLIVSDSGVVMADKALVDKINAPEIVLPDGSSASVAISRFQIQGDIAFLAPIVPLTVKVKPIAFANHARLGATIWTLSGTSTYELSQGIVSRLDQTSASSSDPLIHTSIPIAEVIAGAPLFDATGAVVGIHTSSLLGGNEADFYPTADVKSGVPQ